VYLYLRTEKERERAFASRVIVRGTVVVNGRSIEKRMLVTCNTLCKVPCQHYDQCSHSGEEGRDLFEGGEISVLSPLSS
jgi:hypothetical protein